MLTFLQQHPPNNSAWAVNKSFQKGVYV